MRLRWAIVTQKLTVTGFGPTFIQECRLLASVSDKLPVVDEPNAAKFANVVLDYPIVAAIVAFRSGGPAYFNDHRLSYFPG